MRWMLGSLLGIGLLVAALAAAWLTADTPDAPARKSPSAVMSPEAVAPVADLESAAAETADVAVATRPSAAPLPPTQPANGASAKRTPEYRAARSPAESHAPPPARPETPATPATQSAPPPITSSEPPTRHDEAVAGTPAEQAVREAETEVRWPQPAPESDELDALRQRVANDPFDIATIRRGIELADESAQPAQAIWFAERHVTAAPEDDEARADLAERLLRARLWTSAEVQLEQLTARAPNAAELWYNLAIARHAMGKLASALAAWNRALELLPDNPDALAYRGEVLLDLKRYDDAAADFARVIELEPDALDAYLNRALALWQRARFEDARAVLTSARERFPENVFVLNRLAETCLLEARIALIPPPHLLDLAAAALDASAALAPAQPELVKLRDTLAELRERATD